jgi:hypothetical protein
VSCVSYVACFSGLSFYITPSVFSNMYLSCVLCILCCQSDTQDTGQIHVREYRRGYVKGQSRETGNIGYTRHRTNTCCVSYVASFSGLSFYITPWVFSNMYLSCVLCILCCQFLWIVRGQIHVREYRRGNVKGQSRETGNIGYTRHRTNTC